MIQFGRLAVNGDPVIFDVPRREVAAVDKRVARTIGELDDLLRCSAGRVKHWEVLDRYLDERLFLRPPDVMATGPVVPGRAR